MKHSADDPPSPGVSDTHLARTTTSGMPTDSADGVASPKTPAPNSLLTDSASSNGQSGNSVIVATLEPYEQPISNERILYITPLPLSMSYETINVEYSVYGKIESIRVKLTKNFKNWEVWISYSNNKEAFAALQDAKESHLIDKAELVKSVPSGLDVFYPNSKIEEHSEPSSVRSPPPPRWLIVSTTQERANLFAFRRFLQSELGSQNARTSQVTRFGSSSFLVHANSDEQAAMICNLRKTSKNAIKEIKPHYNFSYARGVIFNRDLYEFDEEEILEMCPPNVWKIFKVPRSSMITATFTHEHLPENVIIEKEYIHVKPYKVRPLQCYNCFGFGHPSRRCEKDKLCNACSQDYHGECSKQELCINCKNAHKATSKDCPLYKREHEALLKANDEHISVGHAKRLLAKTVKYSDKVKSAPPNSINHASRIVNKTPNLVSDPKPQRISSRNSRLSASQLEIHPAPKASSSEASPSPNMGASPAPAGGAPQESSPEISQAASDEASQAISLPDISVEGLQSNIIVEAPFMELDTIRSKRLREASPPQSHKVDRKNLESTFSISKKSSVSLPEKTGAKKKQVNTSSKPSLSRSTHQKSGGSSKK